jgi:hypothetical protein
VKIGLASRVEGYNHGKHDRSKQGASFPFEAHHDENRKHSYEGKKSTPRLGQQQTVPTQSKSRDRQEEMDPSVHRALIAPIYYPVEAQNHRYRRKHGKMVGIVKQTRLTHSILRDNFT